jgi:sulfocyanin
MHSIRACFTALFLSASLSAQQPAAPAPHAGHDASIGLNKEMIKDLTPADFLKLGEKDKTVVITLVAVWSAANYGMNFNGYSHGKLSYNIPTGWNVEVRFINPSPIPHSAIVVERDVTKKLQMGEPYFDGAGIPNPAQGMSLNKATFSFLADEAGEYAIACGFPAHAISGHWVSLNVVDDLAAPTIQLGEDAEPKQATK